MLTNIMYKNVILKFGITHLLIMTTNSIENVFLTRNNVLFLLNENIDEELEYIISVSINKTLKINVFILPYLK
jgi:hypothetical protein